MVREMKASGIGWAGEIPASWDVQKGKNILTLLGRPVMEDDGIITCFRDGEVTLRSKRREDGFTMSDKEIGYQGIEAGDLVVHGMDGFAGAIGISDSRGKGTPVLNVMDSDQNKRFLMYYLRCAAKSGLFLSLSTGIRVRSCDTNWNKIKNVLFALPPISEQHRIVSYLDAECDRIDAVIEQTRASIEEYKKLKQAVITQAVTKGIRPDRPMKDSGSSWIGTIPIGWDAIISRFVLDQISDVDHYMPESVDVGIPYVMTGDLKKTLSDIDFESCKKISSADYEALSKKINLSIGDIVFARYATIGTVCYVDIEKDCIISYSCVTIKPTQNKLYGKYLYYYLQASTFFEDVSQYINSNTQGNVGIEALYKVKIPVPPIAEQHEISEYLDKMTEKLDSLITKKEQLLFELNAYKKAEIYEYVTGKKEVE